MWAPPNINYFYNRASLAEKDKLNQTLDRFNINSHRDLVSESLLRFSSFIEEKGFCFLPKDIKTRNLIEIYKYYYSLNGK